MELTLILDKFIDCSEKILNTNEFMKVKKRNGTLVDFDKNRIINAIKKAFAATENQEQVSDELIGAIASEVQTWEDMSIEDIQDQVEELLMDWGYNDVAKEYILYRKDREIARMRNDKLTSGIHNALRAKNVQNQNANVDELSFGGRQGEAARVASKNDALYYMMSEMSREHHLNNEIYIHDLDSYSTGQHNCLTMPIDDLLRTGFKTRQTDVRPANSINTACQLIAVLFQIQSLQQFGGVSAGHLDWTLVPYVRKSFNKHFRNGLKYIDERIDLITEYTLNTEISIEDEKYKKYSKSYQYALDMTQKELKQAIEGMYHNLNTLQSRSGNQLPFSSINYGTCILPEGRMVIAALLRGSIDGVGSKHVTAIFPCGIFQYMKGVNDKPGTPNYDMYKLALESTSKRLYPNYANVDWSGNAGYDVNDPRTYYSSMGCRTFNGWDINGFGQLKDGRGNICPVTIILPTLAMQSLQECVDSGAVWDNFMDRLRRMIKDAADMLLERFEWICSQDPASAKFMYENNTMAGYIPEEGIRSALKHGTLAIGQIGLAETLQILFGTDQTTPKGLLYAHKIENTFKELAVQYKQQYHLNFGVYYTPAENLCYTSFIKWKKQYGDFENVTYFINNKGEREEKNYFTNSIHVPVWKEMSAFEKIDIESQLTGYSSAGCITYVELPVSTMHNLEALETIVNYAMNKDIPYFAVNVPNDRCVDCGFTGEFNDSCPICGSTNIRQLRRVTGYLSGSYKTAFNPGKICETEDRVKHVKTIE